MTSNTLKTGMAHHKYKGAIKEYFISVHNYSDNATLNSVIISKNNDTYKLEIYETLYIIANCPSIKQLIFLLVSFH